MRSETSAGGRRVLVLDPFAGASGDMLLGLLMDLGVSARTLEAAVRSVGIRGVTIRRRRVPRGAIRAVQATLAKGGKPLRGGEGPERTWREIRTRIRGSSLPAPVRDRALAVFRVLAEAEGTVHGVPADRVHFHEVGALDSIVDLVGAAAGLEDLGVATIWTASLPLGRGTVETRHGTLPVPAPATLELLRGFAVHESSLGGERVTPTAAAVIRALGVPLDPDLSFRPLRIGHGAGTRRDSRIPNCLRGILAEEIPPAEGRRDRSDRTADRIVMLEANLDDVTGQVVGHVLARVLEEGALDAHATATLMKKGRAGILLTVLAPPAKRELLEEVLLRETPTLGVRATLMERRTLPRRRDRVRVLGRSIRRKVVTLPGGESRVQPEFEDCQRVARAVGRGVLEILERARAARGSRPR